LVRRIIIVIKSYQPKKPNIIRYLAAIPRFVDKLTLLRKFKSPCSTADTENKQRIIGSIFPERLIYENKKYRTPKLNRVVSLIFSNEGRFKGSEKRKHTFLD